MDKIVITESALISHEVAEILNQVVVLMPNWKWFALGILIVLGFVFHPIIKYVLRKLKKFNPIARRFPDTFTSHLFALPIERPLAWLITLLIWMATFDAIDLPGKLATYTDHTLRGFITLNIIVALCYAVDAMREVFLKISLKNASSYNFSGQLIPYAAKSFKVLIVVLGLLIALQSFGLNVMSLLAGLGLGGLALALAAQDTAANVFGSITIMFDNPFKVGDWIKVKDMEGNVEEIGFRSTRIRTFYNSVITIPNAMIAKETVDNMGVRPARRIRHSVGLTYETPPAKIVQFCGLVRQMIKDHPKVIRDTVTVNFNKYSESSLDVLINFHLEVFTGAEEMTNQEEIFIEILKIAANLKVDFAYPTTTTYQRSVEPSIKLETTPPLNS